uniref:Uncharacterized protein n=1 Tax=Anguilla anguilla TaxID=7936 RepID=A0A0E9SRJ2_ANGAN
MYEICVPFIRPLTRELPSLCGGYAGRFVR